MIKPEEYLPIHKSDTLKIEELAKIGYPFYKPILYELFEWIQDYNWPVAQKIVPLLCKAGEDIIPVIKKILMTDDDVWKYWVLSQVIDKMPIEFIIILKEDITKIEKAPTDGEKYDEVDIVAKELLKKINL